MTKNGKVLDNPLLREQQTEALGETKVQEVDGEKMECVNHWELFFIHGFA